MEPQSASFIYMWRGSERKHVSLNLLTVCALDFSSVEITYDKLPMSRYQRFSAVDHVGDWFFYSIVFLLQSILEIVALVLTGLYPSSLIGYSVPSTYIVHDGIDTRTSHGNKVTQSS